MTKDWFKVLLIDYQKLDDLESYQEGSDYYFTQLISSLTEHMISRNAFEQKQIPLNSKLLTKIDRKKLEQLSKRFKQN